MPKKIVLTVLFGMIVAYLGRSETNLNYAQSTLKQSHRAFNQGNYPEAVELLQKIDLRTSLESIEDLTLAYEILAVANYSLNKIEDSKKALQDLLTINSTWNDLFRLPPPVAKMAQEEKEAIRKKNQKLQEVKNTLNLPKETSSAQKYAGFKADADKELLIKKPPKVLSVLPFGLNHFAYDDKRSGGIFLSWQALSLLGNIGAFWWKQSYLTGLLKPSIQDEGKFITFNRAQTLQHAMLLSLVIGYGTSVVVCLIKNAA